MDKNELALKLAALAAIGLGWGFVTRSCQLKIHRANTRKLVQWADLAQAALDETWTNHPELISELSPTLTTKINFYNIMFDENLI